jgi:hypothetical protein
LSTGEKRAARYYMQLNRLSCNHIDTEANLRLYPADV